MHLKKLYLICIGMISLAGMNAQTKYAKIVVYRNEDVTTKAVEEYKIYVDDNLTTSLRNYSTDEFYMPEGSFRLRVNDESPATLTVKCSKGNNYYFKVYRNRSLPNKPLAIEAVDSVTAKTEMKYVKKSVTRKTETSNMGYQNAIGIVLEPVWGFNNVGMLSTTTGTEAKLNFGGNGIVGIGYSREFSDNFGWSVELQDLFSSLTPQITNGSVDFNTGIISTTPYFKIPIFKHKQNIKIGAGFDYHFSPTLTYDTEKLVNGIKDEWTYNDALGYHIILFFETMVGKRLKVHTGLKYSDVNYTFSSGKKYNPTSDELKTIRGNSMAVSLGLEYCF